MTNKPLKKIETTMECPNCKTKIDVSDIKRAIKERIDMELDYILDQI